MRRSLVCMVSHGKCWASTFASCTLGEQENKDTESSRLLSHRVESPESHLSHFLLAVIWNATVRSVALRFLLVSMMSISIPTPAQKTCDFDITWCLGWKTCPRRKGTCRTCGAQQGIASRLEAWTPSLLGWRPSLLGWRPLLVAARDPSDPA